MHEWGLVKGKKISEIAKILLNQSRNDTNVATAIPTDVSKNTTFLIDTSYVHHLEDLRCDDLGVWHCTGVKTEFFKRKRTSVKRVNAKKGKTPDVFKITRRFYYNDNVNSLKKSIATAVDANQDCCGYTFVQYIFTDGEQKVCTRPHGRAKASNPASNKPYMRTKKSTISKIKKELNTNEPRKIVHSVIEDLGGIEKVRSGSDIPRNRKQVYNAVQSISRPDRISDPLAFLMQKCKEELRDEKSALIRCVQVTPEPIIFLATEQQLKDVERFCTNPEMFCVLGVDATFELCDYYMTFVTYRNPMLQTRNGNSPAIVGPGILHKTKLERSYQVLGAEIVRWHPPCAGVLALGSDGELNMINALLRTFSSAIHLRCDLHMKDNISSKLSSLGICHALSKEYMSDIFGKGEEGGLIHCSDAQEFDDALTKLTPAWEERHPKGAEFVKYFVEKKASDIKETMTVEIRSLCGLGFPPDVYTQNASESMNRVLKEDDQHASTTRRAKKNVCDIVERFRNVVKRQEQEQFLSVMQKGEYTIKEQFKSLETGDTYFKMNERQKDAVKKRFFNCILTEEKFRNTSIDHIPTEECGLSIPVMDFKIMTVPFLVLEEMYKKAASLLKSETTIVKSPSFQTNSTDQNDVWLVASKIATRKPHSVIINKTGRVVCDKACVGWAQYSVCCHTIAAAEKLGILKKFLEWLKKKKKTSSTTKMANVDMPKSSGTKKKVTQKRKGSANSAPGVTMTFPRVSRVSDPKPTAETVQGQPTTTSPSTNQAGVSMQPPVSSIPQQPAFCSPQRLPVMGQLGSALPHFQQQTYISFPPNSGFSSTQPPPTQPQLSNSIQRLNQSLQPPYPLQGSTRPNPNPGSFEVTLLHLCDPRVSTCYGCGQPIRRAGALIPPPSDIVVTKMRRDYIIDGEKRQGKLGNVYFHSNLNCITSKYPHFFPSLLYVTGHVRNLLLPVHRQQLVTSLGFSV